MTEKSHVTAAFAVYAGTAANGELDLSGLTPNEMAECIAEQLEPDVSLCHQCGREVSDPQVGELAGFTVDGVDYAKDNEGHWVVYDPAD